VSYRVTSLGLIAFGIVGMFSIGRPFFLVGLAMLILSPLRRNPILFWPPLLAVIGYNVGYWAVAPLSCTAIEAVGGTSTTSCSWLIGIGYPGSGMFNPSLDLANQVGLVLAAVVFVVVLAANARRARAARS
jgi:hypothetical protein